jgi:hypothetical protein
MIDPKAQLPRHPQRSDAMARASGSTWAACIERKRLTAGETLFHNAVTTRGTWSRSAARRPRPPTATEMAQDVGWSGQPVRGRRADAPGMRLVRRSPSTAPAAGPNLTRRPRQRVLAAEDGGGATPSSMGAVHDDVVDQPSAGG